MKIACISDTHNLVSANIVPSCDLLIHSGDHTGRGSRDEWIAAMKWLGLQAAEKIVAIPGNHDFFAQDCSAEANEIATDNGVVLLVDQAVTYGGLKIYGSPWQPWFFDWAFNFPQDDREAAREKWAQIPDDVNILVTHGPPKGILDRTMTGEYAGCPDLLYRAKKLTALRLHVFGHIHEGYGREGLYVNAAINDRKYRPLNPPIIVDLAA